MAPSLLMSIALPLNEPELALLAVPMMLLLKVPLKVRLNGELPL